MINFMEEEKRVNLLIDLPDSDIALLDNVKRRMGLSSRGRVISALLQAVIDIQPPAVELARTAKMRKQRRAKTAGQPAEFA